MFEKVLLEPLHWSCHKPVEKGPSFLEWYLVVFTIRPLPAYSTPLILHLRSLTNCTFIPPMPFHFLPPPGNPYFFFVHLININSLTLCKNLIGKNYLAERQNILDAASDAERDSSLKSVPSTVCKFLPFMPTLDPPSSHKASFLGTYMSFQTGGTWGLLVKLSWMSPAVSC